MRFSKRGVLDNLHIHAHTWLVHPSASPSRLQQFGTSVAFIRVKQTCAAEELAWFDWIYYFNYAWILIMYVCSFKNADMQLLSQLSVYI